MSSIRQFGLAALFVIAVPLLGSAPVLATDWGTIDLASTDAEPGALGQATFTDVQWTGRGRVEGLGRYFCWDAYTGEMTVTCQGLTPGARYTTPAGKFRARRDGTGSVSGTATLYVWYRYDSVKGYYVPWIPGKVDVSRLDDRNSSTLVLTGVYPFPAPR